MSQNFSVDQLREVILNEEEGMYERYAALFALRNHGGEEAICAIVASLGARSALLRHEVGLRKPVSSFDHDSVALLEEFTRDPEPIVSQSCEVALSMLDFERCGKPLEVCIGLRSSGSYGDVDYGLKYGTRACCGHGSDPYNFDPRVFCGNTKVINGSTVTASACSDPQNYASWDGIHFSEAANKAIAYVLPSSSGSSVICNPSADLVSENNRTTKRHDVYWFFLPGETLYMLVLAIFTGIGC
ncbi:Deoxyhypusine hydroxylase [Nymphaea thermarum]|nr:Deoxyhypusine hydroxylase [Nymphaea thermarum]